MSLHIRLALRTFFLVLVVGAVMLEGHCLTSSLEREVAGHMELAKETRNIRHLQQLVLQELMATSKALSRPSPESELRRSALSGMVEREVATARLVASPATLSGLDAWMKRHQAFERGLKRRHRSASAITAALDDLHREGELQTEALESLGERLSANLDASDNAVRESMGSSWTHLLLLCLLPSAMLLALVASFARRLAIQVTRLDHGFAELARGNFSVRVAPAGQDWRDAPAIEPLLSNFDRTAEELEKLTRLKSRFHSMALHDLRSPLTTLHLAIHSMLDPATAGPNHRLMLEVADRKIDQLLELVDGLLDVFFGETGAVRAQVSSADANALVDACAVGLSMQAAEREQKFAVRKMPGDATLVCDRAKISQVLENLTGNALKYSRAGDTIELAVTPARSGNLLFSVKDSGPGIPIEDQKRIFEPYYRLVPTDGPITGKGLGLTICKQLIEAHGGKLWVESTPGAGSTFLFELPRAHSQENESGRTRSFTASDAPPFQRRFPGDSTIA